MRFGDIILGGIILQQYYCIIIKFILIVIFLLDKNGSSVVHLAVQMNNIDCLMVLINIGVDLNKKNTLGFTPLYIANAAGI